MSTTSLSALPARLTSAEAGPGMELDRLRFLLLRGAEALCAGQGFEVEQACNQLASSVVNLRPAFAELFPDRNNLLSVDCEQQRRRLLQPVLEARAFYLAALRRWHRSLSLRRSLMEMQDLAPTYQDVEVSRWC